MQQPEYLRKNILEPMIQDILTRPIEWRRDSGNAVLAGSSLNDFMQQRCQSTSQWVQQNMERIRQYVLGMLSNEGVYDYEEKTDGYFSTVCTEFLQQLGLWHLLEAMCSDSCDVFLDNHVRPYLLLLVSESLGQNFLGGTKRLIKTVPE